jgi:hypothetical protein
MSKNQFVTEDAAQGSCLNTCIFFVCVLHTIRLGGKMSKYAVMSLKFVSVEAGLCRLGQH